MPCLSRSPGGAPESAHALSRVRRGSARRRGVRYRRVTTLTRLPRTTLLIAISVVIVIAMLFANGVVLADAQDERSTGGFIGFSLFGVALSAVLLLVVVPRLPDDMRRVAVLGFGGAAVLFCLVFWSTLPFALGIAAIAAAAPGDDRPEGTDPAPTTAGVLLAALAIVAAFVLCVIG
jgi:hypothetical protein